MQVGAATIEVPWPLGLPLAGYSRRTHPARGVHQPLAVRALVASSGSASVCLLVADILCVDAALTARVRTAVSEQLGLAPGSVLLAATHTHAAPAGLARFPELTGAEAFLGDEAPDRVELLVEQCVYAARAAARSQAPAQVQTGVGVVEGVAANRRRPDGPSDPHVSLLRFQDSAGTPLALVFSFACHPTVLDAANDLYSGDLMGAACARLEAALGCPVLGLTGAAGDISTRFTRQASSIAEVERLAVRLSDAVLAATLSPASDEMIAAAQRSLQLVTRPLTDPHQLHAQVHQAETRLAHASTDAERRVIEAELEGLQVALAARARPPVIEAEVQVLRLGGAAIVAFPGELFVEHGLWLKARLAPQHLLVAGYANGYVGYVPTADTTDGYEADVAVVTPAAGDRLLDAAVAAASALFEHPPHRVDQNS